MSPKATRGDGDPLDICVISERPINRAEVLLNARVVGGLQMMDDGEADDEAEGGRTGPFSVFPRLKHAHRTTGFFKLFSFFQFLIHCNCINRLTGIKKSFHCIVNYLVFLQVKTFCP